jgi:hypothetical protein
MKRGNMIFEVLHYFHLLFFIGAGLPALLGQSVNMNQKKL